jgi:hypothetical protein
LDVQNLSGKDKLEPLSNEERDLQEPQAKFAPQNLTPLLITNNILTLSEREKDSRIPETLLSDTTAERLVDKFYQLLSQQPTTTKRQKSKDDCVRLLEEGFSEEQIDYAIHWLITNQPSTGSFTRIAHFIDQALKVRDEQQKASETELQKKLSAEKRRNEEEQNRDEERQVEEIKASLSHEQLETLSRDAAALIEREHGQIRFGRDTLLNIKINDLIRLKYLRANRS